MKPYNKGFNYDKLSETAKEGEKYQTQNRWNAADV